MTKISFGYRARLALTYGVDWLLAITMAIITLFLGRFQHITDIDLTDVTIQLAFKPEQKVPNSLLLVFLFIPFFLLMVGNVIFARRQWWDLHIALLGLTVTYSFTGTAVGCIRIVAGRPRPDFLARCNPKPGSENGKFFGLAKVAEVCQTPITDELIIDGMRSFFSGHVVLLAASFCFVSMYWAGKFHIYNRKAYTSKLWILSAPNALVVWVALTRVTDHRHHWQDATLGLIFGYLVGFVCYRQFYPPVSDPQSHLPYAPRLAPKDVENRLAQEGYPEHTRVQSWFGRSHDSHSVHDLELQRVGVHDSDAEAAGLIATPFNPAYDRNSIYDDRLDASQTPMQLPSDTYPMRPLSRSTQTS